MDTACPVAKIPTLLYRAAAAKVIDCQTESHSICLTPRCVASGDSRKIVSACQIGNGLGTMKSQLGRIS